MNELSENELKLTVSKKELGVLETNAQVLKDKIMEIIPKYNADNYSPATIDKAVDDRALLNKTAKALNDERIKIEKEFMQPFENFKTIVKETTDLIKTTSEKIDVIIKDVENKDKADKKVIITKIFDENVKELKDILTLDKIFDEKWLNKGSWNDKDEFKEEKTLIDRIDLVRTDLITIGALKSKYEVELKSDYLNNFNLGDVIRKNNTLLENEQLLKTQNDESKVVVEEQKVEKMVEMANTVIQTKVIDDILIYELEITAETSKMEALKIFLQTNNMGTKNIKTGKIIVEREIKQ